MQDKAKLLGSVVISIGDLGTLTLDEVQDNSSLTLLCDVDLSDRVDTYSCVTSDKSTLIHVGDFVKYADSTSALVNLNIIIIILTRLYFFHVYIHAD